jgi:hypothetical protein
VKLKGRDKPLQLAPSSSPAARGHRKGNSAAPENMLIVLIHSWKNFGMLLVATVEKMVPAREQPAPTSV